MSKDKKEAKITRRERLCRMLDISPESLIGGYAVEIEGRCFVKIRGGGSILLYTPTEIRVSLSKKREFAIKRLSKEQKWELCKSAPRSLDEF